MSERIYTADIVVLACEHILLIQHGRGPYTGAWALPGGKQLEGELLAETAARELREETGLDVSASSLRGIGIFDAPGRDPRGNYVSLAFLLTFDAFPEVFAGDDAAQVRWFSLSELPDLAFDHSKIIAQAVQEVSRP